jgi:hypothetical protein
LEVVPEPLRSFANILVEVCAYAGTGNVLKIQQLLHICSEQPVEEEVKEEKKEGNFNALFSLDFIEAKDLLIRLRAFLRYSSEYQQFLNYYSDIYYIVYIDYGASWAFFATF